MVVLSSSYVILAALVQNVFYIYIPYNVYDASIMVETKEFPTNNSWVRMRYQMIHNQSTAVFTTQVPSSASNYLRYKVKLQFKNYVFGETEWKTLISESRNNTECANSTLPAVESVHSDSILGLLVFITVTCSILLANLVYNFTRDQYILWLNK